VIHFDPTGDAFENEKNVLQYLRQIRHRNMVQLLSSFSINEPIAGLAYNLLFPLADGSLKDLLDRDSEDHIRLLETDEEVFSELYGLSSALENLHSYVDAVCGIRLIGSHFDLTPRNILIHQDRLLLADFGFSRLRNESSDSVTPFKGGAGDFLAPECVGKDFGPLHKHGRKSDIWSFGGILAVIIAFMVGGKERVQKFRQKRMLSGEENGTTYRFHADGRTHPNLRKAMESIRVSSSAEEKTALDIALWILTIEPTQRPNSEMVMTELYFLAQTARYHRIDLLLNDLSLKTTAIQLRIEQERFTIWCACAGLAEQHDTRVAMRRDRGEKVSWLVNSKEQYHVIANLLKDMQEEMEFLLKVISNDRPVAPVFARLRHLTDSLWATAPIEVKKEMFRLTETAVERLFSWKQERGEDLQKNTSTEMPSWEKRAMLTAMLKFKSMKQVDGEDSKNLARDESLLTKKKMLGHLEIASFGGPLRQAKRVLCEWVTYDVHTIDQVPERLFKRIAAIAQQFSVQPLPKEFKVLRCEGYIHDLAHLRSCLLFSYPESVPADIEPVPLRLLLKNMIRPSLGSLFELAQTLVESVLYFHKADWLHKNISSHNVIFFDRRFNNLRTGPSRPKGQHILDDFSSPYLIGFNHSRPDEPKTFTSGGLDISKMYQHPEYANNSKQRFRRGYDYYSLGLLLLEIGLWEPISRSKLLGGRGIEKVPLLEQKKLWQREAVPLLGSCMGVKYRDAVRLCLSDELLNNVTDFQARDKFEEKVVTQISICCA